MFESFSNGDCYSEGVATVLVVVCPVVVWAIVAPDELAVDAALELVPGITV